MGLFVLPFLGTPKNRLWSAAGVGTFAILIYGVTGRLALSREPRELSLSAVDQLVPFLPTTFWIYSSVYLIYVASCLLQRDHQRFERFLYAYLFAYSVSAIFFLAYPTTFPRADYPLPTDLDPLTRTAFEWLRVTDAPTNCLPSMHVGSAVMSTLPFYRRRPKLFLAFAIWTAAISVATLTTKQHYSVDVLFGALFGALSYWIAVAWPARFPAPMDAQAPMKKAPRIAPEGDLVG